MSTTASLKSLSSHFPRITATLKSKNFSSDPIPKEKGVTLYTCIYDQNGIPSCVKISPKNGEDHQQKPGGVSQETAAKVARAVIGANVYLRREVDPNVQKVRVNFSAHIVKYQQNGREKYLSIFDLKDPSLRNLCQEVTTEVDPQAFLSPLNRHPNYSKGLNTPTKAWYNAHHIPVDSYIQQHHYDDLDNTLRANPATSSLAKTALPKIKATNDLIRKMTQRLKIKKRSLERKLQQLQPHQREEKIAYIRRVQRLEQWIDELGNLDTAAVVRNVVFAPDPLNGYSNKAEQLQNVEISRQEMLRHLMNQNKILTDGTLWWKHPPTQAAFEQYSREKAELLIYLRPDYKQAIDSRGGEERGRTMEGWIIHNILNLKTKDEPSFLSEVVRDLAPEDQELKTFMISTLQAARREARGNYDRYIAQMGNAPFLHQQIPLLFPPLP